MKAAGELKLWCTRSKTSLVKVYVGESLLLTPDLLLVPNGTEPGSFDKPSDLFIPLIDEGSPVVGNVDIPLFIGKSGDPVVSCVVRSVKIGVAACVDRLNVGTWVF